MKLEDKHIIVSYHYVRPPAAGIYPCPPEEFERQIKFISQNYRSAGIAELFSAATQGSEEKLCAVTFDDGTKDHYVNVRPILLKYRVGATFFPIGGVFDGLLPFVHRVHILLGYLDIVDLINGFNAFVEKYFPGLVTQLTISKEHRHKETTRNDYGGDFRVDNFKEAIALAPPEVRERFIVDRLTELRLSPEDLRQEMFMTEEEVRDLSRQGFSVGNHTYTHVPIDQLGESEVQVELKRANTRLTEILGERPSLFSYPWGRSGPIARRILQQTGFDCAVTIERRGVGNDDDPLLIPRYDTNDLRDFLR